MLPLAHSFPCYAVAHVLVPDIKDFRLALAMKRKSPATEHAASAKDNAAKRRRASGNATEHAALAPDIKDSRGPGKDVRLEIMFQKLAPKLHQLWRGCCRR